MESYEYIIYQSPHVDEQGISVGDAFVGIHAEFSPNIYPIQHADWCPHGDISIDTTNPSTYMSCTAEERHKASQPKEDSHLHERFLRENPPEYFIISIGMLPFLIISDTHNMEVDSCEVYTSNSHENT